MTTAAIVGSGPNGLAAAIRLAQAGVSVTVYEANDRIGGGALTSELTVPGLLHDDCSTALPAAVASPFFQSLNLQRHGLQWRHAPIELAHPLLGQQTATLYRDIDETAASLGEDGSRWRRLLGPLAAHPDALTATSFAPLVSWPRHPLLLARLGLRALAPATMTARYFRTPQAAALFGGIAAHAFMPLNSLVSSSVGIMLGALAHAHGWPMAQGGAGALTAALATELLSLGGRIETSMRVTRTRDLGADIVILTVPPAVALPLIGDVPHQVGRAWRRFKHGPAAYKIDLAVEGEVPWLDEESRRAGVVHVGGTTAEMREAEGEISRGRMPERPFILTAQPHATDPSRRVGNLVPFWLYAHVPHGWQGDETERILARVEQFAPGLRERVVGMNVRGPAALEAHNAAYVGGDITGGATSLRQLAMRPRLGALGYRTGVSGVYLGGASTSPAAGVHGMSGVRAAECALKDWAR